MPSIFACALWLLDGLARQTSAAGFYSYFSLCLFADACYMGAKEKIASRRRNPSGRLDRRSSTGIARSPVNAEFLFFLFLNPKDCDALVGDLEERYRLIHQKFGTRRASLWYWKQCVASIGPTIWAWTKTHALKPVLAIFTWAAGKGLMADHSWLTELVEMWKRMRF